MYHTQPCKHFLFSGILLAFFFLAACNHNAGKKKVRAGFSDDTFSETLQQILKSADTANHKAIMPVARSLRYTYVLTGYQPIWVKENFLPTASCAKLIDELEDMRWDGLDPERYHLSAIKRLKQKLDTTKKNSINDAIAFDTMLTHSYLAAAKDLLIGYVPPKKADSLWFHVNDSAWNAMEMLADSTGAYHSLAGFRSAVPTYALLRDEYKHYYQLSKDSTFRQAVAAVHEVKHPDSTQMENLNTIIKKELPWFEIVHNDSVTDQAQLIGTYQFYGNMQVTGKLDSNTFAHLAVSPDTMLQKIAANMERIRWMQKEFGDLYLLVDVPLMELFLRKEGNNAMHMRVVVGRPERQTPSLYAKMANIIINPAWGVPPTILKNDVLPGLQKSGKKYMNKKGLKAYDADGDVVDPSFINENNYRRFTYKQAPGDDNSLGYVKFNMPNHWDIYLHDTPHRDDFTKRNRFLSSGCIRVQQPKEMALYILTDLEKRHFSPGRLDTMIQTHKTKWEALKNKIPVHVAYLTAIEDTTGKHIRFARDIYQRDGKLMSLLN
jgi:L,D-transpeptidase YcbB